MQSQRSFLERILCVSVPIWLIVIKAYQYKSDQLVFWSFFEFIYNIIFIYFCQWLVRGNKKSPQSAEQISARLGGLCFLGFFARAIAARASDHLGLPPCTIASGTGLVGQSGTLAVWALYYVFLFFVLPQNPGLFTGGTDAICHPARALTRRATGKSEETSSNDQNKNDDLFHKPSIFAFFTNIGSLIR